jgi:hypothetical protein
MTDMARVMNERPNAFDDLRIIARDKRELSATERAMIETAADELEESQKAHILTYAQLIEAQGKLIAVTDRLIDTVKELAEIRRPKLSAWHLSSGWMPVKVMPGYGSVT